MYALHNGELTTTEYILTAVHTCEMGALRINKTLLNTNDSDVMALAGARQKGDSRKAGVAGSRLTVSCRKTWRNDDRNNS